MANRNVKPFAVALKVANSMFIVDAAISLLLVYELGKTDLISVALVLLPPAWSAFVFSFLISWYKPIRPTSPMQFPANITYPLVSSALVFTIAVLTCGKSPSIVALETEAYALKLWTNYPVVVISAIAKVVVLSLTIFIASKKTNRAKPGEQDSD